MSFTCTSYGVSPAMSLIEPSQTDIELSEDLKKFVHSSGWYQNVVDMKDRKQIICELESAVQKWVEGEANDNRSKDKETEHTLGYGSCIRTFGGQAIEVVSKGSDIDAVCLLPNFIRRARIFESLGEYLQSSCAIQNMRKVENAFVPIICFEYKETKVDLSFSVLRKRNLPIASDLDVISDDILRGLDEASMRSLSGIRDAELLLNLVPNADHFRNTLKAVKAWAKRKGIHNSAMGYPGGIAWAVMVARTCQLYPNASVSMLVPKVFTVFSQWPWPRPLILRPLIQSDLGMGQFDPVRTRHLMPILTPAYPEHNCAYTVSASTLDVVRTQMQEACATCEKIVSKEKSWDSLFEPIDVFNRYKHFIMVTSHAASLQEHLDWSGFLESQVRKFVSALESVQEIKQLHLYATTFENRKSYTCRWFIGMKLQKKDGKFQSFDIAPVVKSFRGLVNEMAKERNFLTDTTKIDFQHIPKKQLDAILTTLDMT